MDMKINSAFVRRLRKKKLWSQEQLAAACGLSLRTIQRLEAEGQASAETLKALASVFEIEHERLQATTQKPVDYANVQIGYVIILIFCAIAIIGLNLLLAGKASITVFGIGLACCLVPGILFSTLTTKVNESVFEWSFAFGFLHKSVPIEKVLSWDQARNKFWWGLGIRLTPVGWVYCVSGLDAVALKFSDGKKIRVGTDDPEGLIEALTQAHNPET